jgi:hypothetical protein
VVFVRGPAERSGGHDRVVFVFVFVFVHLAIRRSLLLVAAAIARLLATTLGSRRFVAGALPLVGPPGAVGWLFAKEFLVGLVFVFVFSTLVGLVGLVSSTFEFVSSPRKRVRAASATAPSVVPVASSHLLRLANRALGAVCGAIVFNLERER